MYAVINLMSTYSKKVISFNRQRALRRHTKVLRRMIRRLKVQVEPVAHQLEQTNGYSSSIQIRRREAHIISARGVTDQHITKWLGLSINLCSATLIRNKYGRITHVVIVNDFAS